MFGFIIRRAIINVFHFFAIAIWFPFLYFCMWAFVNAAVRLNYINFQTVGYTLYSVLLLLLPVVLRLSTNFDKQTIVRSVCNAFAILFLIVVAADLVKYKGFIGYTFVPGDAIFSYLITNMPNIWGALSTLAIALLYYLFGKFLFKNKWLACLMYFLIFLLDGIIPITYAFGIQRVLPRMTWIEKSAFILPQQLFILIFLVTSATNREFWRKIVR